MRRDFIIALVIGLAFILPTESLTIFHAIPVVWVAWYLLVGTNPESKRARR